MPMATAFYFAKRQALWLGFGLAACVANGSFGLLQLPQIRLAAIHRSNCSPGWGSDIREADQWRDPLVHVGTFAVSALGVCQVRAGNRAGVLVGEDAAPGEGATAPQDPALVVGCFCSDFTGGSTSRFIYLEPDLGTTLLLVAVALIMMWVAGSPAAWLGGIVGAGGLGITAFLVAIFRFGMFQGSYQVQRIATLVARGRSGKAATTSSTSPRWRSARAGRRASASATAA